MLMADEQNSKEVLGMYQNYILNTTPARQLLHWLAFQLRTVLSLLPRIMYSCCTCLHPGTQAHFSTPMLIVLLYCNLIYNRLISANDMTYIGILCTAQRYVFLNS